MESERLETVTPKDILIKVRMAQHALYSTEGIDLRTASILLENGLMKEGIAPFVPEADVIAAVRNPTDPNRIASPPGPVVLVKGGQDKKSASVVTVAEFLLSESLDARQAAIAHLEALATNNPPILTERSQRVLAAKKEALQSEACWRRSAVHALDTLEDDFLYNLAGLSQCVVLDYRDGVDDYAPRVLQPTLASINAIPFGIGSPSQEGEKLLATIEDSIRDAVSLDEVCDRYYARLGHLPLCGVASLGGAVHQWTAIHGVPEGFWEEIWKWARRVGGPLPRYHACQVFIYNPSLVPESERSTLWKEILEVLVLPEKEQHQAFEWGHAWRLRFELLCYFAAHFECLVPGEDGERIGVAALWVTERVASAFAQGKVDIKKLIDNTVIPLRNQSSGTWEIVRPPTSRPCSLRYAVLFGPQLWSLSILGELGRRIREFAVSVDQQMEGYVQDTLMRWLLHSFPPLPNPEKLTYAFDKGVVEAASAWLDPIKRGEEVLPETCHALVRIQMDLTEKDFFENEIRNLPAGDEATQYILTQSMRSMAYVGRLPPEFMREVLWNSEWQHRIWKTLSKIAFANFWDSILEMQLQNGGDWLNQLPHLWARMCDTLDDSEEGFGDLLDHIILGAINSNSPSALKRLLERPSRIVLQKAAEWRQRLDGATQLATQWPRARIRAFQSILDRPKIVAAIDEFVNTNVEAPVNEDNE